MTEENTQPAGDRQDPAEPKRVDKAVETENQPEPTPAQTVQPGDTHEGTSADENPVVSTVEETEHTKTVTERPAEGTGPDDGR